MNRYNCRNNGNIILIFEKRLPDLQTGVTFSRNILKCTNSNPIRCRLGPRRGRPEFRLRSDERGTGEKYKNAPAPPPPPRISDVLSGSRAVCDGSKRQPRAASRIRDGPSSDNEHSPVRVSGARRTPGLHVSNVSRFAPCAADVHMRVFSGFSGTPAARSISPGTGKKNVPAEGDNGRKWFFSLVNASAGIFVRARLAKTDPEHTRTRRDGAGVTADARPNQRSFLPPSGRNNKNDDGGGGNKKK